MQFIVISDNPQTIRIYPTGGEIVEHDLRLDEVDMQPDKKEYGKPARKILADGKFLKSVLEKKWVESKANRTFSGIVFVAEDRPGRHLISKAMLYDNGNFILSIGCHSDYLQDVIMLLSSYYMNYIAANNYC